MKNLADFRYLMLGISELFYGNLGKEIM